MISKRKALIFVTLLAVFAFAVSAASAQGRGNGPGPGDGIPNGQGLGHGNGPGPGPVTGQGAGQGNGPGNGPCDGQNCQAWGYAQAGNGPGAGQGNGPANGQGYGPGDGSCGGQNCIAANRGGTYAGLPPAVTTELPDDVIAAMTAGLLDEYEAYATYEALMEQVGAIRPFVNIQRAEAQHIEVWEYLFDRYGLERPAVPDVTLPEYASVADACQAAADLEAANFGLYDDMLAVFTDYPDLTQVAQALRASSEFNHLPALERCASF